MMKKSFKILTLVFAFFFVDFLISNFNFTNADDLPTYYIEHQCDTPNMYNLVEFSSGSFDDGSSIEFYYDKSSIITKVEDLNIHFYHNSSIGYSTDVNVTKYHEYNGTFSFGGVATESGTILGFVEEVSAKFIHDWLTERTTYSDIKFTLDSTFETGEYKVIAKRTSRHWYAKIVSSSNTITWLDLGDIGEIFSPTTPVLA